MAGSQRPELGLKGAQKRPLFKLDLNDHALYLADHNAEAALKFVDSVEETLDLIASQPKMGVERLFAGGAVKLRMLAVSGFKNHLIYYQPLAQGLIAIRLLHGAMDSEAVFE